MNRFLYSLFSSFPSIKFDIHNPDNKYYQFIMNSYNGIKVTTDADVGIGNLIFAKQCEEKWTFII